MREYQALWPERKGERRQRSGAYAEGMNGLFIIIIIVAIVLAVVGGLVEAVNFLLWVGIILAILAVIGWLIRSLTGRKS